MYTVLLGRYEELNHPAVAASSDLDFICFTDDPGAESDAWGIRQVQPVLPADPGRSSRFQKLLAHLALPEYEVSLYIDNSVDLLQPPERLLEALLPDGAVFGVIAHSYRSTIADEFDAVADAQFDASWVLDEQRAHYLASDPGILDEQPLWTGVMARRHHESQLCRAMERWWLHLIRYSRRDQLSVWAGLRHAGLTPTVALFDNFVSEYHRWPVATNKDRTRAGSPPVVRELVVAREDLARAISRITELEEEVSGLHVAGISLSDEIDASRRGAARCAEEVRAIEATMSWRLTAPLRVVRRRLPRG